MGYLHEGEGNQPELETAEVRDRDRIIKVLTNLMPFVLEDYNPNYATPAYRRAVEAAKAVTTKGGV